MVDQTAERWLARVGGDDVRRADVVRLRRFVLAAAATLPVVPAALLAVLPPVLALPVGVGAVASMFLMTTAAAFAVSPPLLPQAAAPAEDIGLLACPGLALLVDPQGCVVKIGGRDRQNFPPVLRDCLDAVLADRVHVSDRIPLLQALDQLRQGAGSALADVRVHKAVSSADARQFVQLLLDFTAIRNGEGDLVQVFVQASDVSEIEALRREAQDRREEARTAHDTKSRFLAAVSHELRTPLNAILGFSDVLAGEYFGRLENDRQREYVGLIRQSGAHLLSVVNTMLDMSKIETGRYELLVEPFSAADAIETCRAMLDLQARDKGITLTTRVPRGMADVVADRRALQQILINLAGNAIKFTERGGVVSMEAALIGKNLVVTVSDTGIGIAHDKLGTLGQPFTQVQNDYTRQYEGTGLGLALVKGLVSLHRGTFAIRSKPGKGTVVTLTLPAQGPDSVSDEQDLRAEAAEFPPRLKTGRVRLLGDVTDQRDCVNDHAEAKIA